MPARSCTRSARTARTSSSPASRGDAPRSSTDGAQRDHPRLRAAAGRRLDARRSCAGATVGDSGRVVGVDFTDAQVARATGEAERHGIVNVRFVEASIDRLPFDDGSFDVVISNGVVNLSPVKHRVFAEASRVLCPGGRLALADIVSASPLKEATRRNTELLAACIAGAIPTAAYLDALVGAGCTITATRRNDYRFSSDRAREACHTYGVESTSIAAVRR